MFDGVNSALGGIDETTRAMLGLSQQGVEQFQGIGQQFSTAPILAAMRAGGPGLLDPQAQGMLAAGGALTGGDVDSASGNALRILRAQAQPDEERAVNSRVQDLFNRGILSSTSGARALGELGLRQEQADIQRQIEAKRIGLNQFQAEQQAGQGLLGLGANTAFRGADTNQALAGMLGGLQLQGLSGQSGAIQNALAAGQYGAAAPQARGLQRLGLLQNVFGFGDQARNTQLNQLSQILTGTLAMNQDERGLIDAAINASGGASSSGAAQAQALLQSGGSPGGGFLTGLGTGLFEQAAKNNFGLKPSGPQGEVS